MKTIITKKDMEGAIKKFPFIQSAKIIEKPMPKERIVEVCILLRFKWYIRWFASLETKKEYLNHIEDVLYYHTPLGIKIKYSLDT